MEAESCVIKLETHSPAVYQEASWKFGMKNRSDLSIPTLPFINSCFQATLPIVQLTYNTQKMFYLKLLEFTMPLILISVILCPAKKNKAIESPHNTF